MPESLAENIASLPDVDEVAPVLIVVDQKNLGVIYGIDYDRFAGLSNGFTFVSGGPFHQPDEAIADDLAAKARKLRVGCSGMNSPSRASSSTARARAILFRSRRLRTTQARKGACPCFLCAARAIPKPR
jgi:hypothetical protein